MLNGIGIRRLHESYDKLRIASLALVNLMSFVLIRMHEPLRATWVRCMWSKWDECRSSLNIILKVSHVVQLEVRVPQRGGSVRTRKKDLDRLWRTNGGFPFQGCVVIPSANQCG